MTAWGITDCGLAREQNQDAFHLEVLHESSQGILAVCDGMGGAKSGNVASFVAVDAFVGTLRLVLGSDMDVAAVQNAVRDAVDEANRRVYEKARSDTSYYGMGTTLVGAVVTSGLAVIANVGDSRAYIIDREEGIERITRDHSVVEDLLYRGELSPDQVKNHPSKNIITRALGTENDVSPDVFSVDLTSGDFLLLCSDGLTNAVDDMEILYEVLHGGDTSLCCERLVAMANERGGPDNITIILLSI
ncbi:MAG: Stp1/IreP family PP2C-type Ser/Thr phosphatase [Oscillospiraceae bacterium]|nr:Stp1/IreP family PP2C-type Ser/Thr phosphatase [Oscillospiraceae bacterium]